MNSAGRIWEESRGSQENVGASVPLVQRCRGQSCCCVWGGHSCPPPLVLDLKLAAVFCGTAARAGRSRPHLDSLLDVAGGQPALFQILLVIVLGGVKSHRRNDLGDDRLLEPSRLFQGLF